MSSDKRQLCLPQNEVTTTNDLTKRSHSGLISVQVLFRYSEVTSVTVTTTDDGTFKLRGEPMRTWLREWLRWEESKHALPSRRS